MEFEPTLRKPWTKWEHFCAGHLYLWRVNREQVEWCAWVGAQLAVGFEIQHYEGLGTTVRVHLLFLTLFFHRWPAAKGGE